MQHLQQLQFPHTAWCEEIVAAGFLVVLPSQSRHDDGQELLEGGLDLSGELVAHLGGDDDGQAVRQQLQTKTRSVSTIRAKIVCLFVCLFSYRSDIFSCLL